MVVGVAAGDTHFSGVLGTIRQIVQNEGPRALYSGIVPGLQRQMAFSAIRIGGYETAKQFYMKSFSGRFGISIKLALDNG